MAWASSECTCIAETGPDEGWDMALVLVLAFSALGIFQVLRDVREELDADICQHMQERVEWLRQEIAQLFEEMEQNPQEPSRLDRGALHFMILQEWQFWPPAGHIFHTELGTEGETLLRNCHLHVELECMCIREQWQGDVLCFLHHPEDELMSRQEASLLQTFCTGSYLNVQKTAFWLQELMSIASVALPQMATYNFMVLPSPCFWKLKLTDILGKSLRIELILAVEEGNSETFVTME
ncbi:PREDICTED: inositol 1,4,5-trisphosphate receptor-interacting protein-like 1 [Eurypyga helias]|uniref:inositol 1,4,5-trisphosphate receptor-interacting protein-like 1 n=1 Tax=Eurypyga helias TaxID=54383 RepID=UPI00052903DC|nr:PREDICTED: inositol 1,4,5-trisphosphate receptor-interacting protein-like 1 [Eurypyga helias]